ncbi:MAG: hypothetical protein Q9219_000633 [cf. Caloplaca sp. 3 TL-2023]
MAGCGCGETSGLLLVSDTLMKVGQILLAPTGFDTTFSAPRIPPPIEVSSLPGHVVSVPRPKSSPSTFGPNVEDLLFPENPFRLKSDEYVPPMYSMAPLQSTKAPTHSFYGDNFGISAPTMSPARVGPVPIAPDPAGLRQMNALKRMREEEDFSEFNQKRRKRAPSQSGPVELNEEEQLLLKLKEEENLPWKDIAVRFQTDLGKSYQVPALQMRFKRLRERMRTWTETDVQALEQAYDYWEKFQFDIIAAKVRKAPAPKGTGLTWLADAGLRGSRTVARQILRSKMGRDTPRTDTVLFTVKLPPGPMGHGTLQPGGLIESSFTESQPEATPYSIKGAHPTANRPEEHGLGPGKTASDAVRRTAARISIPIGGTLRLAKIKLV